MGRDAEYPVCRQMSRKIELEELEPRRLLSTGGGGGESPAPPFPSLRVSPGILSPMGSPNQAPTALSQIGKSTPSVDLTDGKAQSPADVMDQTTSISLSNQSSPTKKDDVVSPLSAVDPFETASANIEIDYALGMSEAGESASISLAQVLKSTIRSDGSTASTFASESASLGVNEIAYASVALPRLAARVLSSSKGLDATSPGDPSVLRLTVLKSDEIATASMRAKSSAGADALGVWSIWGRQTDSTLEPDSGSSSTGLADDEPIPAARVAGLMEKFARFDLNSFDDAIDQLIGDLEWTGSHTSVSGTPMDWIPTVIASGVALGVFEAVRRRRRGDEHLVGSADDEALFPADLPVWNVEER